MLEILSGKKLVESADAIRKARAKEVKERGLVKRTKDGFLFANGYQIEFNNELDTTRDAMEWIYHMNCKQWWTPQIQADFIWMFMRTFRYPVINELVRIEDRHSKRLMRGYQQ